MNKVTGCLPRYAVGLLFFAMCSHVQSQSSSGASGLGESVPGGYAPEVPGIQLSNIFSAYPHLDLGLGFDDNPSRFPDLDFIDKKKFSGSFVKTEYGVDLVIEPDKGHGNMHQIVLTAKGDSTNYSAKNAGDLANGSAGFLYTGSFSSRLDASLRAMYKEGNEAPRTVNDNSEVNAYKMATAGFSAGYGSSGAKGRLEVDVTYSTKRYKLTDPQSLLQRQNIDILKVTPRFLYRVNPDLRLLTEVIYAENSYPSDRFANGAELDSRDLTGAFGAIWDVTDKTAGTVELGKKNRTYDSKDFAVQRPDNSQTFYALGLSYQLTEIATITVDANSDLFDDSLLSGTRLTETLEIGLAQNWTDRFGTAVGVVFGKDSYQGFQVSGVVVPRDDDMQIFKLEAQYQFAPRFSLRFTAMDETRSSSLSGNTLSDNFNYNRTRVLITTVLKI